jgi:hypothetical protein
MVLVTVGPPDQATDLKEVGGVGYVRPDVKSLDLKCLKWHHGVTELDSSIGNLKSLSWLSCSSNHLSTLPESIGDLTCLTVLSLKSNQLSTLPKSIGKLTSLTLLDCSNNQLSTLPKSIGELSSLTTLHCSNNQLSTLPKSIGNLASLRVLHCSNNKLEVLPESIGNLTKLTTLDCSNNNLKRVPGSLMKLGSMSKLVLVGNRQLPQIIVCGNGETCWKVDAEHKVTRPTLLEGALSISTSSKFLLIESDFSKKLDLSRCNFQVVPPSICQLKKMKELVLSHASFSQLPDEIGSLESLEILDLSNNDNLQEVPKTLSECKKLESVIIKDCEYSTKILQSLDYVMAQRRVRWKDRPLPTKYKLIIKFLVCTWLLVMAVFTIVTLQAKPSPKNPNLAWFRRFVVALSVILLAPHAVDVGTMMDQFLQAASNEKLHTILRRQEELASRIQWSTLMRYTIYGLLSSLGYSLCFFWCTRPWDLKQRLKEERRKVVAAAAEKERASNSQAVAEKEGVEEEGTEEDGTNSSSAVGEEEGASTRPWDEEMEIGFAAPHAMEHFCCTPVASVKHVFAKWPCQGVTLQVLMVMIVEWVDTVQTLSLFPLSWYVITTSDEVTDVLVNAVAVSVFATLDDEAVRMFTKPQQSLLDRWRLYTGSGEDLTRSGKIEICTSTSKPPPRDEYW